MVVFEVQKKIEKLILGIISETWVTERLTVSVTPVSITLRQWSDFWITKSKLPEWFKEAENLTAEEVTDLTATFDEAKTGEYLRCVVELVACFCDKPELLRSLPFESSDDNSIIALYAQIIHSIYSYEPKLIESFEHKGVKFVFPKSTTDTFGREWIGAELTTGESIEALQSSHILNSKNEFGEYVLNDRKYHTDIALLASLARKVNQGGTIETMPIETSQMRAFFDERVRFFKDAPMNIALDMAFFLSSSKLRSVNTPIFQLLINRLQQVLTKQNGKKGTNTSGKRGVGR